MVSPDTLRRSVTVIWYVLWAVRVPSGRMTTSLAAAS
jgi:hypothetical protein